MKGKQIVFTGAGRAELMVCEVAPPGAGEVLVESDYSAVSAGTERAHLVALPNTASGTTGFPVYPGYSSCGRIVELGAGVESLQVGDRVIVTWGGHRSHFTGPAGAVVKVEDSATDSLEAAFAHIASFSLNGVRKLRLEIGESAMVAGLGLLGMFAVQFARLSGAAPVLAADFDPVRRALAAELGADMVFSPDWPDYADAVRSAAGGTGVSGVVEVTGSAAALKQALDYVAFEGRVSLLGCTRVSDAGIDFYRSVHKRGVSLIGAHTDVRAKLESRPGAWTSNADCAAFLKLLAAKRIQVRPMVSEVVSPEEAPRIYSRLAEMKNPPLGMVFNWQKTG